jgi:hypothetical protein
MGMVRHINIVCPSCGQEQRQMVEPMENHPTIVLLLCDSEEGGCDQRFAAEIRLHVSMDYSTCRLSLPSQQQALVDCLSDAAMTTEPDPNDF